MECNSRKHQSYKYDCIDKVCGKLQHHLQLKYSYFPQQSAGSSLSLCVNFMEGHFLKSNDEFGAGGGGSGGKGTLKNSLPSSHPKFLFMWLEILSCSAISWHPY